MAVTDITLESPYVMLTVAVSQQGFAAGDTPFKFGQVLVVHPTSDKYVVGDSVLFFPERAISLRNTNVANTIYYIIDENLLFLKEDPIT